jgi:hypothetical protein
MNHTRLRAGVLFMLCVLCVAPLHAETSSSVSLDDTSVDQGATAPDAPINDKALEAKSIVIDPRIYKMEWNKVPFDTNYFMLTDAQLPEFWKETLWPFMHLPFFSIDLLKYAIKHYPDQFVGVDPYLLKHLDVYQKRLMEAMRNYLAGNFQLAYQQGIKLGAMGWEVAALSEVVYAYYLTERRSVKYMMLQDVINQYDQRAKAVARMLKDPNPVVRANAKIANLGYAYAVGRLAEEQSIAVAVMHDYLPKAQKVILNVLATDPSNPLALMAQAAMSSEIIRRVGKFTGRITYNARTADVVERFERVIKDVPDQPLILYEFANSYIYMDHKRDINTAMKLFVRAVQVRPRFAMQALDCMYAYKRLNEVRIYALDYRSFDRFDKERRHFAEVTDRNLNNVLGAPLTLDMLKHPEKYKLPPLSH